MCDGGYLLREYTSWSGLRLGEEGSVELLLALGMGGGKGMVLAGRRLSRAAL